MIAFRPLLKGLSMPTLENWDLASYRAYLKTRARLIGMNPKVRVRLDESDLVQETLLRAADPETPPCVGETDRQRIAWLEKIQDRIYIDKFRAEHADKRDVSREQAFQQVLDQSTVHWEARVLDPGDTPLDQLLKKEMTLEVAAMIQQLPEDQRDVVIARELLHLSLRETAEELGKTEGQVAGLYRRGLQNLKELLRARAQSSH
jgi:RNA polymerase sigma-70 factor, ECF subfamily